MGTVLFLGVFPKPSKKGEKDAIFSNIFRDEGI